MIKYLNSNTVLMSGNVLADLEINRFIGMGDDGDIVLEKNVLDRVLDEEKMMGLLRDNPRIANELVSYDGEIIYMGKYRDEVGMNFLSRSGRELEGSNRYGIFLENCRDRFIREMKGQILEEQPVRETQVTVDFTPAGAGVSDIEQEERNGSTRYIHAGVYRPASFMRDSDELTGTSGHAQRASASDVSFKTFECPFGLTRKHKILVGNAAEASMYYEQALRGELDWKSVFTDLRRRGLVKGMPVSEEQQMIKEMTAQFSWMRERILRDTSLSNKVVVADSMVIPDKSMGRTVYHPEFAPSPAHILARYINNPHLLYTASENGVVRAMERQGKDEAVRFSTVSGQGDLTIVVDGSDTIGGRVPGTRAVSTKKQYARKDDKGRPMRDSDGRILYETRQVNEFAFKSQEEVQMDYAAFSERMDNILRNVDPSVKVRFVCGMNVGADKMLAQYVEERKGNVYDWNYTKSDVTNAPAYKNNDKDARLSVVRMRNFSAVYPVLVGRQDSVVFNLSDADSDSEVRFDGRNMSPDGFVSFSVSDDIRNRYILERGSLAASSGLPFLHVIENYSEKEQLMQLEMESENTKYALLGEPSYKDSLFEGQNRTEWDLDNSSVMSHMSSGQVDMAIPFVANNYDASVFVNGVPYNSVYGAYCALMMKNAGIEDRQAYRDLAQAGDGMISMQQVFDLRMKGLSVEPDVQEKCMRNAVHMMTRASSRFVDSILNTGDSDIVCVSTFGDPNLFTDLKGKGENRFGVVFMSERVSLQKELELSRMRDEEEARRIAAELQRRQKKVSLRAPGEKIASGLPRNMDEAMDAVWFLGTSQPVNIALPDESPSFVLWEEGYNEDILNREKASRPFIEDVEGNRISNDYVYFFPSSLTAIANRYPHTSDPNQRDLTGVSRKNPETGEEFVCAYGIAVKRNREFYEHDNKFGKTCSFLLDNDGATVANSIYAANAEARATALRHGMALCHSAYSNRNGDLKDALSRVFEPKVWDYERSKEIFDRNTGKITQEGGVIIPKEVTVRRYNKATRSTEYTTEHVRRKSWVDNPHAAPKNHAMIKRFESMLQNGSRYPLTCFSMPRMDYEGVTSEQFMNDLNFALNMANATALTTGRSLRFPLDEEGRINLGPGVPKEFREMAERRINHYIGVVQDESLLEGRIPVISRIPISRAFSKDRPLERDGSDFILRPNDLLVAFGRYNFQDILVGNKAPMHEMAFKDDDGNLYKITDGRFSSKFTRGEINKYLRYERNDEIRWNVRSSDASKIPAFIHAVKSYVARAKEIKVEYRLFSEEDCRKAVDGITNLSMKGFVHLLASNEDNYELRDAHVLSARPESTMVEMDADWVNSRPRQGAEDDQWYAGKVEANDGFKGWAMYRYTQPDGKQSEWKTVDDLEFAKDLVLTSVKRVYNSDTRVLPSEKVIDATLKSIAVKDCAEDLFNMELKSPPKGEKEVTLPAVSLFESHRDDLGLDFIDPNLEPSRDELRRSGIIKEINVHYGKGDNASLSNFAIRPFDYHIGDEILHFESVEQGFQYMKSYYTQCSTKDVAEYRKAVLSVTDGKELRDLGRSLPAFDVDLWDNNSPFIMKDLLMSSFQSAEARELLLGTGDAIITHSPETSKWAKLFPQLLMEVRDQLNAELGKDKSMDIVYTTSTGGYQKRTLENAQADDVDFTLAFAVDFNTYGEKATARAAGDSLIAVDLPLKKSGGLDISQKAVGRVVDQIVECLPEEYLNGQSCGVNIAGNGIYTLKKHGVVQEDMDRFMCAVGRTLKERGVMFSSVRSGGQTGVDEAGAAMGKALGIDTTVHAPNDWAFRGENGKDIKDRKAFESRFAAKDYEKLASFAESFCKKDQQRRKQVSVKM